MKKRSLLKLCAFLFICLLYASPSMLFAWEDDDECGFCGQVGCPGWCDDDDGNDPWDDPDLTPCGYCGISGCGGGCEPSPCQYCNEYGCNQSCIECPKCGVPFCDGTCVPCPYCNSYSCDGGCRYLLVTINPGTKQTITLGASVVYSSTVSTVGGAVIASHDFDWKVPGRSWVSALPNTSGTGTLEMGALTGTDSRSLTVSMAQSSTRSLTMTPTLTGTYIVRFTAYNEHGLPTHSPEQNLVVLESLEPPTNLTLSSLTSNEATITWTVPSGIVSMAGYRVFLNGVSVGSTNSTSFPLSGLVPMTTYSITVSAMGAPNNPSAPLVFTTLPSTNSSPPPLPSDWANLHGLNVNDTLGNATGDGLTNIAKYNLGKNPGSYNQGASALGNTMPAGWPTPNLSDTHAVGTTAGEFSVDKSGAATYTIPIAVTPGTAGMEPKITLNYSSQAAGGIAGYGWSIGGLSAITRGPQTKLIDGQNRAVDFSSDDRFYLDGQRMVVIKNETYGANGAEYRTEIESFTRVVSYDSINGSPGWFRAWTKSGLIIEFGRDNNSRFCPQNQSVPLAWAVSKISDTAGNYMTYHYTVDATNGEQVLDSIKYTQHENTPLLPAYASLEFEYDSIPRPDASFGYIHGVKYSISKRLAAIKSYYGTTVVRSYTIAYSQRPHSKRSMLDSITEAGLNGVAYHPLIFDYTNPDAGFVLAPSGFLPPTIIACTDYIKTPRPQRDILVRGANQGVVFIDLNGDGRPDCLQKLGLSGTAANMAWLNTPEGWIEAIGENGMPDFRLPGSLIIMDNQRGSTDPDVRFADFNNDSLVDVMDIYTGDVYLNTGTGFAFSLPYSLGDLPELPAGVTKENLWSVRCTRPEILDLDGDGRIDVSSQYAIITYFPNFPDRSSPGTVEVPYTWLNNGEIDENKRGSAWTYAPGHAVPMDNSYGGIRFLDLSGDGLVDIIQAGGTATVSNYAFMKTSTGWSNDISAYHLPLPINGEYRANTYLGGHFVDLNGDGLPDFITRNSGTGISNQNDVFYNVGTCWVSGTTIVSGTSLLSPGILGHNYDWYGSLMIDIDNDGLPDFVHGGEDGVFKTHINTGAGWSANESSYYLPCKLSVSGSLGNPGIEFLDLNADGAVDIIWSWKQEGTTTKGAYLNRRANPDRLSSITNSHGVAVAVTYAPLTELAPQGAERVYEKGSGSQFPVQDVIGPMHVVKTVKLDDGAGRKYDIDYRYGDLRTHSDHGNLGFGWMQAIDSRTQIRITTSFMQNYPFIGLPDCSITEWLDGTTYKLLSITENTYNDLSLNNNKTIFPYVSKVKQQTYELNGVLTSDIITTYVYDPGTTHGNATIIKVDTSGGTGQYTRTVTNSYDDDNNNPWITAPSPTSLTCWLPGRPLSTIVETKAPDPDGGAPLVQSRVSDFEYYSNGFLREEIIEPETNSSDPTLKLTNTYTYNKFGCRITTETTGEGLGSGRTTTTTFDSLGRFPWKITNALGHTETHSYYPDLGVLRSTTGPNGLTTSWEYDGFARPIKETRADGTQTTTNRHWANTDSGALYYVETKSFTQISGDMVYCAPPAAVFYDKWNRPISEWSVHPGGTNGATRIVITETRYDSMGRAHKVSLPYFRGTLPSGYTQTFYDDILNRPLKISTPDDEAVGGVVHSYIEYDGLVTRTTNPLGQVEEVTKNMQGQVVERINNAGPNIAASERGKIHYAYDAGNNLVKTTVYHEDGTSAETTTFVYDNRGRKISMTSPDMGTWTYVYNAFGELTKQTDAKGQTGRITYDALGRIKTRTDCDASDAVVYVTTWTYDDTAISGAKSLGKLSTVLVETPGTGKPPPYKETYHYDDLGRFSRITRRIDGNDYPIKQEYDSAGRPAITEYPGNFRVRNVYNAFGLLREVRAANDPSAPRIAGDVLHNHLFWQADSYAVNGAIESSTLGNGLTTDRAISPITGRLGAIAAGIGSGTHAQDIAYTHNLIGHVTTRQDYVLGREESFAYDGLNRLTAWKVAPSRTMPGWGTVVPPVTPGTVTLEYNALGNITQKSDYGHYTYSGAGNAGPHAVTSVVDNNITRTYQYDANGNMTRRTDINRVQDWTVFNQVEKITQGITWAKFRFGAARERIVQERSDQTKTIYIGSLLEIVIGPNNTSEKKYHIHTPEGQVATRTLINDSQVETRYYHSDGLGSITAVSDEYGRVEKRFAFDPWGRRTLLLDYHAGPGGDLTRGFTGHEHLDDFGLIHMNGRVFDPALARFLSADPFTKDAGDAQTFNRYSYVENNPLNATDPSGYWSFGIGRDGLSVGGNWYIFFAGINIGWRNGGSVGVYGGIGCQLGNSGFGIGARINYDYSFRSKSWTTSYGGSLSYNGASINANYNKYTGWSFGIGFGEDQNQDRKSSWNIGPNLSFGTHGLSYGVSGTWDPSIRGQRASADPAESIMADYLDDPNSGESGLAQSAERSDCAITAVQRIQKFFKLKVSSSEEIIKRFGLPASNFNTAEGEGLKPPEGKTTTDLLNQALNPTDAPTGLTVTRVQTNSVEDFVKLVATPGIALLLRKQVWSVAKMKEVGHLVAAIPSKDGNKLTLYNYDEKGGRIKYTPQEAMKNQIPANGRTGDGVSGNIYVVRKQYK